MRFRCINVEDLLERSTAGVVSVWGLAKRVWLSVAGCINHLVELPVGVALDLALVGVVVKARLAV